MSFSAGLQIGWELDFWGKFRRSIEAADAGYFASIAQYDDLQVLMAAQVASFYCSIRTVEARLVIARENAALQKRSLEITERLFKGGYRVRIGCATGEGPVSWHAGHHTSAGGRATPDRKCTEHIARQSSGPIT